MTDVVTPDNPSVKKKNLKRIFLGFVLIFLAVFSLAVALYWPEFQKQFFPQTAAPSEESAPGSMSLPATETVREQEGSTTKEGLLWADPDSSQYLVTLGKTQGIREGKKLKVYDGTDLLGQVVVDRALETVSYVLPEKSVDISKDTYYRVVAE
jgi:hypothetical protein